MSNGTVIYYGGFALPDKSASANRVVSNGKLFSALAAAHINVRMIDQGSSELNIIIGVANKDFERAIQAIYNTFVVAKN